MNKLEYFYRTVVFTRKAGKVALADIHNPEETTALEEWLGVVVSLADGHHTLQELADFISNRYPQAPTRLDETLDSVVERLLEANMIKLTSKAVELPYYLASPIEELDKDKAKKLMVEDGYVIH